MNSLDLNTLRIYTIFHHTYQLLYCEGHVQIISNSIIYMKRKAIE